MHSSLKLIAITLLVSLALSQTTFTWRQPSELIQTGKVTLSASDNTSCNSNPYLKQSEVTRHVKFQRAFTSGTPQVALGITDFTSSSSQTVSSTDTKDINVRVGTVTKEGFDMIFSCEKSAYINLVVVQYLATANEHVRVQRFEHALTSDNWEQLYQDAQAFTFNIQLSLPTEDLTNTIVVLSAFTMTETGVDQAQDTSRQVSHLNIQLQSHPRGYGSVTIDAFQNFQNSVSLIGGYVVGLVDNSRVFVNSGDFNDPKGNNRYDCYFEDYQLKFFPVETNLTKNFQNFVALSGFTTRKEVGSVIQDFDIRNQVVAKRMEYEIRVSTGPNSEICDTTFSAFMLKIKSCAPQNLLNGLYCVDNCPAGTQVVDNQCVPL